MDPIDWFGGRAGRGQCLRERGVTCQQWQELAFSSVSAGLWMDWRSKRSKESSDCNWAQGVLIGHREER